MKCPFELPVRLERVNALRSEIFTKDGVSLGSFPHDWAVYILTVLNGHEGLVEVQKTIQEKSDKLDARIADGKHDDAWPENEYIKDEDWAGMIGEQSVYHRVLRLFEAALAAAKE